MADALRDDDAGGQRCPGAGQFNPADHVVMMPDWIPVNWNPNGDGCRERSVFVDI